MRIQWFLYHGLLFHYLANSVLPPLSLFLFNIILFCSVNFQMSSCALALMKCSHTYSTSKITILSKRYKLTYEWRKTMRTIIENQHSFPTSLDIMIPFCLYIVIAVFDSVVLLVFFFLLFASFFIFIFDFDSTQKKNWRATRFQI